MKLYRTAEGFVLEVDGRYAQAAGPKWDDLVSRHDLHDHLRALLPTLQIVDVLESDGSTQWLAPVVSQEVWAAGVTYQRSMTARNEESHATDGDSVYDKVYKAARPELFFKATANRVVGHRQHVAIRADATWSVPEPELAILVSAGGHITGYTVGNDMSSRDIEAENPLYLPQAKVYKGSCALGPGVLVTPAPLPVTTEIRMEILRGGGTAFAGSTTLTQLRRTLTDLVEYLFRSNDFPAGCYLLTGTGIVPPDSFTLAAADEIRITIEGIGTLINFVA